MEDTITLTLSTRWMVGIGLLSGLVLLSLVVGLILPRNTQFEPPLEAVQKRLGLGELNPGLFLILATLWALLFAVLVGGLFWLIWQVLWELPPGPEGGDAVWYFRFLLVQVTALTAVLAAVVTLPLTLNRLRLQREVNRTADESLFNQKITEAAADLHARRQRTMRGIDRSVDVWEDDVVRRNAAINRLEGLVEERMRAPVEEAAKRDVLGRISRLLSVYVRELSKDVPPVSEPTDDRSPDNLRRWAQCLKPRSDMENATRTLGSLRGHARNLAESVEIDLEGANLQGCRLSELDFTDGIFTDARMQGAVLQEAELYRTNLVGARMQGADFWLARMQGADLWSIRLQGADLRDARLQGADLREARLQGAELWRARMQGANFTGARLQGAVFRDARMQGAELREARLQGANLREARLQGVCLWEARMDDLTDLCATSLSGAAIRSIDETTISKLEPFWDEIFADGTVKVPEGQRPEHWADNEMSLFEFDNQWRAWQRSIGMGPDNPE